MERFAFFFKKLLIVIIVFLNERVYIPKLNFALNRMKAV